MPRLPPDSKMGGLASDHFVQLVGTKRNLATVII